MNVYAIKAGGSWAGGMAIVAATTEDQAKQLAMEHPDHWDYWNIDYIGNLVSIEQLPVVYEGPEKVLAYYEHGE